MFMYSQRLLLIGVALWAAGTVLLRLTGEWILRPGTAFAAALQVGALVGCGLLVRGICRWSRIPREQVPAAAVCLVIPTLLLDSLSTTVFFPLLFSNLAADRAGAIAALMLASCAGGLLATLPFAGRGARA
jgi:hypothetical protein